MDRQLLELAEDFRFEAAHYLPNLLEEHKCRRMHGHSFRREVAVRGPVDPTPAGESISPISNTRSIHYLLNEVKDLEAIVRPARCPPPTSAER